jgi:hypothetical protein
MSRWDLGPAKFGPSDRIRLGTHISQEEGTQPLSLHALSPSQVCNDMASLLPHSPSPPTLLATVCVTYQTFSQTISFAPDFTAVNYCQKLPANLAQIPVTVSILSTHI